MNEEENERLLTLLGWAHVKGYVYDETMPPPSQWSQEHGKVWRHPDHKDTEEQPDLNEWQYFPDLQKHVRGLPMEQRLSIDLRIGDALGADVLIADVWKIWAYIAPTILGKAILRVKAE